MRGRLLIIVLGLTACLLAALGLPLVITRVEQESREFFMSRADDTARFADEAESALSVGRTQRLTADLTRYDELYTTSIFVTNEDGLVICSSREGLTSAIPGVERPLLTALAGLPTREQHALWPWDDRPYVIAEPIVRDSRILGAVITMSDTAKSRSIVVRRLVVLGLGVVALTVVALASAVLIVRWVLKPVWHLDRAAHAIGNGAVPVHVAESIGPPELRRLAARFNAMADSIAAAARNQRAFVAQATHQLRNPLTALRIRLENTEWYLADCDAEGRAEIHEALGEVDRLNEVINALLQLARAEAVEAVRLPVDVSAMARSRARAWRAAYARSATTLTVDVPDGLTALCLPNLLGHALDGLLDNALKYASGCAVELSVRCGDDGLVEVRVSDSGPGLTADELAHACDRFWRSPRHQDVPGTGLGLATARTLIEESGGSMELSAREPTGIEVLIRLPAVPTDLVEADPLGVSA
ncbi:sensor histidine kinase [Microbispora rosea]|uniref:sensor histidine kinase n=1 Tax=Microbispora rosea TaxID=58117 RepID=UPI0034216506